jgi:hypothetical protein
VGPRRVSGIVDSIRQGGYVCHAEDLRAGGDALDRFLESAFEEADHALAAGLGVDLIRVRVELLKNLR